jgi:copper(I)-binding protein
MMRRPLALPSIILTMCLAQAASAASVNIESAWLRVPPPGAEIAAVYFTVRNASGHSVTITSAESPVATMAMIHESRMTGGKAEMRMHDDLVLAPGQTLSFAPNGLHVMLQGLKRRLLIGEKLPLALDLSTGEKISFTAVVRPLVD